MATSKKKSTQRKIIEVTILGVKTTSIKKDRRAIVKVNGKLAELWICDKANNIKTGKAYAETHVFDGKPRISVYANV